MRTTKTVCERRREIIDTAKELFMEKGFDKTQISDIAKRMNAAQGLVYHYFKSKAEILYAVIDVMAAEKRQAVEKALSEVPGPAMARLTVFMNIKLNSDDFGKLLPSIMSDVAILEYFAGKITGTFMPVLVSIIRQGNSDGSWKCAYPEETAQFILRGLSGFLNLAPGEDNNPDKRQALLSIIIGTLSGSQEKKDNILLR